MFIPEAPSYVGGLEGLAGYDRQVLQLGQPGLEEGLQENHQPGSQVIKGGRGLLAHQMLLILISESSRSSKDRRHTCFCPCNQHSSLFVLR